MSEYNGEERRKDMIDFKVFMAEMNIHYETLCETIKSQRQDIKDLMEILRSLPCKERGWIPGAVKGLWVVVSVFIVAIVGAFIAHMVK